MLTLNPSWNCLLCLGSIFKIDANLLRRISGNCLHVLISQLMLTQKFSDSYLSRSPEEFFNDTCPGVKQWKTLYMQQKFGFLSYSKLKMLVGLKLLFALVSRDIICNG